MFLSIIINAIKNTGEELENELRIRFEKKDYEKLVRCMYCIACDNLNQTLEYVCNSAKEIYTFISNPKYRNIDVSDICYIQEDTRNTQGNRYSYPGIIKFIKSKMQSI